MKKEEVKKIEEEIKQKTTLPEDIKEKIRKEIFINILTAIGLVMYFIFIILSSVGIIKNIRSTDFNIISMIILGVSICLFEISYKKDNGKIAIFGIEALATAIFTLFLPYIIFELSQVQKVYYLIAGGYIGLYYIVKCICLSLRIKKKYITELSDIKDIIKKEKRKLNIKDSTEKQEEKVETISNLEVNNNEKVEKEIKQKNKVENTKNKTNTTTKKTTNNKKSEQEEKVAIIKSETSKVEENTKVNDVPKKRGRPKKQEKLEEKTDNKQEEMLKEKENKEESPKRRGRPKTEEVLKKINDKENEPKEEKGKKESKEINNNENAPKKRGRPKKEQTLKETSNKDNTPKEEKENKGIGGNENTPKKRGRPRKVVTNND